MKEDGCGMLWCIISSFPPFLSCFSFRFRIVVETHLTTGNPWSWYPIPSSFFSSLEVRCVSMAIDRSSCARASCIFRRTTPLPFSLRFHLASHRALRPRRRYPIPHTPAYLLVPSPFISFRAFTFSGCSRSLHEKYHCTHTSFAFTTLLSLRTLYPSLTLCCAFSVLLS